MVNDEHLQLDGRFAAPDLSRRPDLFLGGDLIKLDERLPRRLARLAALGTGGIIPLFDEAENQSEKQGYFRMREIHDHLLALSRQIVSAGMDVSFAFEHLYESIYLEAQDELSDVRAGAMVLLPIEYVCSPDEEVQLLLRADPLMSVVAIEGDGEKVLDLRGCVDGRVLRWQAPEGSWRIVQYICADAAAESEEAPTFVNPLSYASSMAYLRQTYAFFADILEPLRGTRFRSIIYRDSAFHAANHRNWDPGFNAVFADRFGFDPAVIYPALFEDIGENSAHYKALLLDCRAQMFADGMLRAYADFASELGVKLCGSLAEPKLPACSLLSGDALGGSRYAAGALLEKAYLYGANSIKLAAGAACNYGLSAVSCEIYRDYPVYSADLIYSEACNAFSHGANAMLVHPIRRHVANPEDDIIGARRDFFSFVSRTQTLLQGGEHVADIAMLYPIYSLHAQVYFYQAQTRGFEYPDTPANADYMSLINSISIYAGHDLTLLHPETMRDRCYVQDGTLYLNNGRYTEAFRVVILPSAIMISLANLRMLAEFFASGGKVLSTGELPRYAFEYDESGENDREVRRLVEEIFGAGVLDGNVIRLHDYHTNEAGGEAYHLPASATALDGTEMVPGALINETLSRFDLPYDVLMPGMIRLECTGALSLPYPEFVRLGLHKSIPGRGMLSHIHKRVDGREIYYFANTTERDYARSILLRGALIPELWDPHNGEITPLEAEYVRYRDTVYTKINLNLSSGRSQFCVAAKRSDEPDCREIDSIEKEL